MDHNEQMVMSEKRFLEAVDLWCALRQPVMGDKASLKKLELQEREARFELANAAVDFAWCIRFGRSP